MGVRILAVPGLGVEWREAGACICLSSLESGIKLDFLDVGREATV